MKIEKINTKAESKELVEYIDDIFDNWLNESSFAKENACCPGRTRSQIIEKIENMDNKNYEFIVNLDDEEKVKGMIYISYFEDGSAYIGLINIHPQYRNKGIFKVLLASAIEQCKMRNRTYIRLRTWNSNTRALLVFEKCEFEVYEKGDTYVELRKYLA